jgi:hypothetical protein
MSLLWIQKIRDKFPLKLIKSNTTERVKQDCKKTKYVKEIYALSSFSASSSLGRAGIAPFLVVVIAPHAFANLSTALNLGSSCN